MNDLIVTFIIIIVTSLFVAYAASLYVRLAWKQKRDFWHHGVRLPSVATRCCWYKVTLSVGCRPWAGHEGDVYLQLVGSECDSNTFLINGEVHSRLNEADSHQHLYATVRPLGEIENVIVMCGATVRRKSWYLSSVHVEYLSDDQEREWYFPHHEWIDVFLEPIKVTLCGVNPEHDINKRLMLGWLSRGVSDFHLWTSQLFPLKHTPFDASQRHLCSSLHLLASIVMSSLINWGIPYLGPVVLGVYTSSAASLPVYVAESLFRKCKRHPAVVREDVNWYSDPKSIHKPIIYRLSKKTEASDIACSRCDDDASVRLKEFLKHDDILHHDREFWEWLSKGAETLSSAEFDEIVTSTSESLFLTATDSSFDLPIKKTIQEKRTLGDKVKTYFNKLKSFFQGNVQSKLEGTVQGDFSVKGFSSEGGSVSPKQSEHIVEEDLSVLEAAMSSDGPEFDPCPIMMEDGKHQVDASLVWKVDSVFSIDSINLKSLDLQNFETIESMPVAEFDRLREGRRSIMGWIRPSEGDVTKGDAVGLAGSHDGVASGDRVTSHDPFMDDLIQRHVMRPVSPVPLPSSVENLSLEDGEMVSMIYFDQVTGGRQWSKASVPDDVYKMTRGDVKPFTDVWNMNVTSLDDGVHDAQESGTKEGMSSKDFDAKMKYEEMLEKYPEIIPRERIFSMLFFLDYARKLVQAYREMTSHPEMYSSVTEVFALFAKSRDGPRLFARSCVMLSDCDVGRKAFRDVISVARRSPAWMTLICDVTQRLRYQGDNVRRIQEKYGLSRDQDRGDVIIPTITKSGKNFDFYTEEQAARPGTYDDPDNQVYNELLLLRHWSDKIICLGIPRKECPLGELSPQDLRRLSRFYRFMLMSPDGALLFGEIMLQIASSGNPGSEAIAQLIMYVTSQEEGIARLIDFHSELGKLGREGRKVLLRLYMEVKAYKPHGAKLLSRLANQMYDIPSGRMLIEDLQMDGRRGHLVAQEVIDQIHSHLKPYAQSASLNLSNVISRLNAMAQCMLTAVNHAKAVLEGQGQCDDIELIAELLKKKTSLENFPERELPPTFCLWHCRHERSPQSAPQVKEISPIATPSGSDSFRWSPSGSDLSCEVPLERSDVKPGLMWQPLDLRAQCNIYKQEQAKDKEIPKMPNFFCRSQLIENRTEFYLQSKDHEKFFMNFKYADGPRVGRKLGLITSGWGDKPEVDPHQELRDVASQWGRGVKVRDGGPDPDPCFCGKKPPMPPKGRPPHPCLICTLAHDLADVDEPHVISDIITYKCKNTSRLSTHKLPPFPCIDHVTDPHYDGMSRATSLLAERNSRHVTAHVADDVTKGEKSDVTSRGKSEVSSADRSRITSDARARVKKRYVNIDVTSRVTSDVTSSKPTEDSSNQTSIQSSTEQSDEYLPSDDNTTSSSIDDAITPSAGLLDDVTSSPSSSTMDAITPFPSAGKVKPQTIFPSAAIMNDVRCASHPGDVTKGCGCKKPDIGEKARESARLRTLFTKMPGDFPLDDVIQPRRSKLCACNDVTKAGPRVLREKPIIASTFVDESIQRPKALKSSIKGDVIEVTSPPKHGVTSSPKHTVTSMGEMPPSGRIRTMAQDIEHWANEKSSESEFSGEEYCDVCRDDVTLKGKVNRRVTYLPLDRGRRQEDDLTSSSEYTDHNSATEWLDAGGCCNNPGCRGLPPKGATWEGAERENEERRQSYERRSEARKDELDKRYLQWHPPGRHALPHVADRDQTMTSQPADGDVTQHTDDVVEVDWRHSNKPIVHPKFRGKDLDETCQLHKLPKFDCCRVRHDEWTRLSEDPSRDPNRVYAHVPLECACKTAESFRPISPDCAESPDNDICPECHVTMEHAQQRLPCSRYLLPLKALRCYEAALLVGKSPKVTSLPDTMDTARDVIDSSDVSLVAPNQQQALMELMGLTKRKGARHASPTPSLISIGSSTTSSDACCHVKKARQLPTMHLQGFGCESILDPNIVDILRPLPMSWWRRHEHLLRHSQSCVDECVRSLVLVARNKKDARTEHEKTCQACRSFYPSQDVTSPYDDDVIGPTVLGPRYSEMLPVLWRPTIREFGEKPKSWGEHRSRIRFYRQIIQQAVTSTRIVLLTPDLVGQQSDDNDPVVTSHHATKLAYFREMMKSFTQLWDTVASLRESDLVGDDDVRIAQNFANEVSEEDYLNCSQDSTLIDDVVKFMKDSLCGSVSDCRVALENPWELPVKSQHQTKKFLFCLRENLSGKYPNDEEQADVPLADALESCVMTYFDDVIRKVMTHTCILRALNNSTEVKQHLSNINNVTRLGLAKLLRFSDMLDSAMHNIRHVMGRCLKQGGGGGGGSEWEEEWWKRIEKGADASSLHDKITAILNNPLQSTTLDDVLIEFERMRHQIKYDMTLSSYEMTSLLRYRDDVALALANDVTLTSGLRESRSTYDAWTASEVTVSLRDVRPSQPEHRDVTRTSGKESTHSDVTANDVSLRETMSGQVKSDDVGDHDVKSDDIIADAVMTSSDTDVTPERPRVFPSLERALYRNEDSSFTDSLTTRDITSSDDVTTPMPSAGFDVDRDVTNKSDVTSFYSDAISTDRCSFYTCLSDNEYQEEKKVKKRVRFNLDDVTSEYDVTSSDDVMGLPTPSGGEAAVEVQDVTRDGLKTKKGRKMLEEIFGTNMTPEQMTSSFECNTNALIGGEKGGYSHHLSTGLQTFMLGAIVACGACAVFFSLFIGPEDHVILSALPIAILVFGFVLEPLKCLTLAWILSAMRRLPYRSTHPLYIKSDPTVMKRASALSPSKRDRYRHETAAKREDVTSASDYETALYEKYCRNLSRPGLPRKLRRKVPALAESDVSIEEYAASSSDLEEAKPSDRQGALDGGRQHTIAFSNEINKRNPFGKPTLYRGPALDQGESLDALWPHASFDDVIPKRPSGTKLTKITFNDELKDLGPLLVEGNSHTSGDVTRRRSSGTEGIDVGKAPEQRTTDASSTDLSITL